MDPRYANYYEPAPGVVSDHLVNQLVDELSCIYDKPQFDNTINRFDNDFIEKYTARSPIPQGQFPFGQIPPQIGMSASGYTASGMIMRQEPGIGGMGQPGMGGMGYDSMRAPTPLASLPLARYPTQRTLGTGSMMGFPSSTPPSLYTQQPYQPNQYPNQGMQMSNTYRSQMGNVGMQQQSNYGMQQPYSQPPQPSNFGMPNAAYNQQMQAPQGMQQPQGPVGQQGGNMANFG